MLDVSVPQVGLESPRIMSLVGQREAAGVPEHMGMRLEAQLGLAASAFHKPGKSARRERRAPLAGEHERRFGVLFSLQLSERSHFVAQNRIGRRGALLDPANMQTCMIEVHLVPAQISELANAQA